MISGNLATMDFDDEELRNGVNSFVPCAAKSTDHAFIPQKSCLYSAEIMMN